MNHYRVDLAGIGGTISLRVRATSTAEARIEAEKIAQGFRAFAIVLET